ncbi:hypothetical protein Tco_1449587, partial [Tanacetum coccineum]
KVPALYDDNTIVKTHVALFVTDSGETLELAEESRIKMLAKQNDPSLKEKKVNIAPVDYIDSDRSAKIWTTWEGQVVSQHPATVEETRAYFESLYNNLAIEVEKVNTVNRNDARVQNFEIQFLKEAAKFVRDFKSLAEEADESLTKHKALELEIKRLLRAVVSQDIISIVQSNSVIDTLNLQTELERTKERFENCIINKENEYAKLWNDWYKKCEECKYDKILYDKAYNDMQQKIERLQAQLGDQKGKSKDTLGV